MFLYIQSNDDWYYENKFKYGITQNPLERINSDQHSYKTLYKSIYEYKITDLYKINLKQIDKIISIIGRNHNYINELKNKYKYEFIYLNEINKYLVNNNGGTEFIYHDGLEILEKILLIEFNILGIEIIKINVDELQKINNTIKNTNYNDNDFKFEILDNNNIILRDYQIEIINKALEIIRNKNKLYLELATGTGKTIIAYSIINNINPKTVIILTPRINICKQNISDKYKQILTNKDCNILCFCIQSFKKVYEIIKSEKYSDIFIWFDEAHWGIDGWIEDNNNNHIKDFFLIDEEYIKYRLFTSASPDKNFIYRYKNIYGELYTPIKVSELMKKKWLCNIKVHIYKEKYNDINNESLILFIFNKFKELNKKLGMNFNKDCDTALERFIIHYKLFINDKIDVIPFLLLNDEYINKLLLDNDLDIYINKDLTDVNIFNDSNNAIAYVVDKYSMGYDNKNVDFLIFSDPKLSYQDIIQSIGRGTRPDQEGENGKNKNKINDIILPVNINELDDANKYNKIKEILKYLLIDLELEPEQVFNFINNKNKTNKSNIDYKEEDNDNIEIKTIESIIYNIYTNNYHWTLQKLTKQLLNNNIHNYKDYQKYKNDNEYLNLPEELFRSFPKFDFYNTYKLNECPYYTKEECIKAIEKYQRDLIDIDDDDDRIIFLNNKDNKIPNECLWYFYGGNSKDYLIINHN